MCIHDVRTLYVQYAHYFFCNLLGESQLSLINYKISYQESKDLQTSVITSLFDNDIATTLIERQPKKNKSSRFAGCGTGTGSRGIRDGIPRDKILMTLRDKCGHGIFFHAGCGIAG